jgi:hypothetical protein
MNDLEKVNVLFDLLLANGGRVDVADLKAKTGTDRRARRAIFVARKYGANLEPVRVQGSRQVLSYVVTDMDALKAAATKLATDHISKKQVHANVAPEPEKVPDEQVQKPA